jgi:hypothetical protein
VTDAWRYHLIADAEVATARWPAEARTAFHEQVMSAPPSWRPDGDDAAERAAGARALARAWLPVWRVLEAARQAPAVARAPAPIRKVPSSPAAAPGVPAGLTPAEQEELARLWLRLGRDLALAVFRR